LTDKAEIITWHPGIELPQGSAAFGVFDGLHRGHQHLIESTRSDSTARIILTFDRDPLSVVAPHVPLKKLMTDNQRLNALTQTGVDYVVVIPFDGELSILRPPEFLQTIGLLDRTWQLDVLHVGQNLHFGANGSADASDLARLLPGVEIIAHKLLEYDGEPISSTRIRSLIETGNIAKANELLGHRYLVEGTVVHGDGRGQTLGFPTANIALDPDLVMPADGVYAGTVNVDGRAYAAAISVGLPSTFDIEIKSFEAYILDFDSAIYGVRVTVDLTAKLRSMQKFANADALVAQLRSDVAAEIGRAHV
jgi:riboflavin kinase/FMN adenylyltransferase